MSGEELQQLKERLRQVEERQRLVRQAAHIGAFEWDIQTGINTWSPELEALYGLLPGTFGKSQHAWEQLVHPDDLQTALTTVKRALDAFTPVEGEWRVKWADGSEHWLNGRFQAFKDAAGRPVRLLGVNIDITERKEAELERARSEARLRLIAESARLFAASTTDFRALLDAVAKTVARLIGDGCMVTLLEPDGQTLVNAANAHRDLAIDKPNEQQPALTTTSLALAGSVVRSEEPLLLADSTAEQLAGQLEPALRPWLIGFNVHSVAVVPIRVRLRVIGALSLFRSSPDHAYSRDDLTLLADLADRAGLAIENARLYDELERRVAERTSELEAANHELETFSYSVSHDLRTPLRGIDGFAAALNAEYGERLDAQGQRYLQRIRSGTQRMSALIDDMLNLSRLNRAALRDEAIDLAALAREVASTLKRHAPQRRVELTIDEPLTGRGDSRLLTVVLENLLGNAWKFTAATPQARIHVGQLQQDGQAVYFVRDNGAGFDMAYADKLFTPFQRLHTAEEFEGTGVGLATVQRIITRHRGRIWAEGAPGRGATFYFTLGAAQR